MEKKVFPRPAVADQLENFVEARLHSEVNRSTYQTWEEDLVATVAQPAYVAINPKTGVVVGTFLRATLADDAPFIQFLADARANRDRAGDDELSRMLAPPSSK